MSNGAGTPVDKWKWLAIIASASGPREATTRHVLHVLALHMNQAGKNAWPSQAHLAMRTGLSERAVRGHLNKAWRAGWVHVYAKHPGGHGWKLHEYVAAVPVRLEDAVPLHPWEEDPSFQRAEPDAARYRSNASQTPAEPPERGAGSSAASNRSATVTEPQRPANDAEPPERGATTSGISRPNVRHHVPTNSPRTLPVNSPGEGALASKHTALVSGIGKKLGGEKSSAKKREALDASLQKAVRQYPGIDDARLAQMYETDVEAVQTARRAAR